MTGTWKNDKPYWNVNGSNNAYCRKPSGWNVSVRNWKTWRKTKKIIYENAVFFNLALTDGLLVIKVLQSVDEFLEEGKAMHHCVYTNEYYNRDNTLILSARIDGKRIETVELSLDTFKVVQSRGVCNSNTEYHDRIINLVESNAELIRQRMNKAA